MLASSSGALRRVPAHSTWAKISHRLLHRDTRGGGNEPSTTIHPSAVVHPGAIIGQGVSIGAFCTIGAAVKIGRFCKLYPGSHILGETELGEQCVVLNGAIVGADLPGRTIIGSNNAIGHYAVVGIKCQDMKYEIAQDVPKYMMVSGDRAELRGLNLEGLRRHGFSSMEVRSMRKAYQKIFMPMDNSMGIEDRLAELEQDEELVKFPDVCSMVQSIRDSFKKDRRGICKFRHWNGS